MARLQLFDDVPASITQFASDIRLSAPRSRGALDELAFVMKSITRMGGLFCLGGYLFGHDDTELWGRSDTITLETTDQDLFHLHDLSGTLADRSGLAPSTTDRLLERLDAEVAALRENGHDIRTPRRWLAPERDIERQIQDHPEVLARWGFRIRDIRTQVRLGEAGRLCERSRELAFGDHANSRRVMRVLLA